LLLPVPVVFYLALKMEEQVVKALSTRPFESFRAQEATASVSHGFDLDSMVWRRNILIL
jgi:hypothetical protein